MAKKNQTPKRIVNRRAKFDYELGDSLVVGLSLTGAETKALRMGHGQLRGAYVTVKENEIYLINAQINSAKGVIISETDETRSRKLLAKRREIDALIEAKKDGRRYIKLRIAVGRGKKHYDKRDSIKRRQQERDIARSSRL
jgi:SsrA-binding protein